MKSLSNSGTLATLAAVFAVGLWSLSPVFITLIGGRLGAAEVFLIAIVMSLIVSLVAVVFNKGITKKVVQSVIHERSARSGLLNAVIAGVFIGMWYFGFYQALNYGPKIEVTIVAFVWPLLSIIAMRIFAKNSARPLTLKAWSLILLSFVGVALITLSGGSLEGGDSFWGFFWAIVAALGSGLYLPFAVKASASFSEIIHSGPLTTLYSVSVSNVAAFITTAGAMLLVRYPLDFSKIDVGSLLLCAVIGIGVYLCAEVAWTWAFRVTASLTLSSLPYFSPAVSAVLLAVLFSETLTIFAVIGVSVIIVSNLVLHFDKKKSSPTELMVAEEVEEDGVVKEI